MLSEISRKFNSMVNFIAFIYGLKKKTWVLQNEKKNLFERELEVKWW